MNVLIRTENLPDGFRWDPRRPVTGTTKFYVRVAESLAALGHSVEVIYDGPAMVVRGVSYLARAAGHGVPDLLLDCNYQGSRLGSTRAFQWTSFFDRQDTCVGDGYDRLFLVSDYVWSTLEPAVKAPVTVVELGCDMPTVADPRLADRPRTCCYTSSPDRGGNYLASIWAEVRDATGYDLVLSPYGPGSDESAVQSILDRSRFWLYPALGTDSILSTLEAQARGCVPIFVPHMALPVTCRYGIQTDLHRFKETVITVLSTADHRAFSTLTAERAAALAARPIPSWADTTNRILAHV